MDTMARWDLTVRRNDDTWAVPLQVVGLDASGLSPRAQIRLSGDSPNLLLDLPAIAIGGSATATGVRVVSVTVTNGVPTTALSIQIAKADRQDRTKLPYYGEVGDTAVLAWGFQIAGITRIQGQVYVPAQVVGADGAPADRPAGYGSPAVIGGSASGATLTIAQDGGATLVIDGAGLLGGFVAQAQAAQAATQTLHDQTVTLAGQAGASAGTASGAAIDQLTAMLGAEQLVDLTKVQDGYIANGSGAPPNGDTSWFNVPIRVKPGGRIIVGIDNRDGNGVVGLAVGQNGNGVQLYDASGAPAGFINGPSTAGSPINIPTGVGVQASVQVAMPRARAADLVIVQGSTLPAEYIEFGVPSRLTDLRRALLSTARFHDTGVNRVKPGAVQRGSYIDSDGNIVTSTDWAIVTVPITQAKATISHQPGSNTSYCWARADLRMVGPRIVGTGPGGGAVVVAGGFQLTRPAAASFLVMSIPVIYLTPTDPTQRFVIIDGAVTLPNNAMFATPAMLSDGKPWAGRTIIFKGDSQFQEQPWITDTCNYAGAIGVNFSRGGTSIDYGLTAYIPAHFDAQGNVVPAVERPMTQADLMAADLILLSLTYNSAYQGGGSEGVPTPIGSLNDAIPTPGSGAAIPTNFIPAMRYVIQTYRAWNPNCRVAVIGNHHRFQSAQSDALQQQYYPVEKQVCFIESVEYLDMMFASGLNQQNSDGTKWDGIHCTPAGYLQAFGRPVRSFLNRILPLT